MTSLVTDEPVGPYTRGQEIKPNINMIEKFYHGQIHGTRLFITIHGGDNIKQITKLLQNYKTDIDMVEQIKHLSFIVPPNTHIIEKSIDNNVVFGNGRDDLENMLFQSQPLYMQTESGNVDKGSTNCYGANIPETGYEPLKSDKEISDIPDIFYTHDSYKFIGDELKKHYYDLEGQRRILHTTHVYGPGDRIFDKRVNFERNDAEFDIFKLPPPIKKSVLGEKKSYRDFMHDHFLKSNIGQLIFGLDWVLDEKKKAETEILLKEFKKKEPHKCLLCEEKSFDDGETNAFHDILYKYNGTIIVERKEEEGGEGEGEGEEGDLKERQKYWQTLVNTSFFFCKECVANISATDRTLPKFLNEELPKIMSEEDQEDRMSKFVFNATRNTNDKGIFEGETWLPFDPFDAYDVAFNRSTEEKLERSFLSKDMEKNYPYFEEKLQERRDRLRAIDDLKRVYISNYDHHTHPLLHNDSHGYLIEPFGYGDGKKKVSLNKFSKLQDQRWGPFDDGGKCMTLHGLVGLLYEIVIPTEAKPLIINMSHCSPALTSDDINVFDERTQRVIDRARNKVNKETMDLRMQMKTAPNTGPKGKIRDIRKDFATTAKRLKTEQKELIKIISNATLGQKKLITEINIEKMKLFKEGRERFCHLRGIKMSELNNKELVKELNEYNKPEQTDLPRVNRHIVMMGSMERHDWYVNVSPAYFDQLLGLPKGVRIEQEGLDMLYNHAFHDIFGRLLPDLKYRYDLALRKINAADDKKMDEFDIKWRKGWIIPDGKLPVGPNYGGNKKKTRKKRKTKRKKRKTKRKKRKTKRKKGIFRQKRQSKKKRKKYMRKNKHTRKKNYRKK